VTIFDHSFLTERYKRFDRQVDPLYKQTSDHIIGNISDISSPRVSRAILIMNERNDYISSRINESDVTLATPHFMPDSNMIIYDDPSFFLPKRFDIVICQDILHLINDVQKFLISTKSIMMDGGFLFASIFGTKTLEELKSVFIEVEEELYRNVSPRIIPFYNIEFVTQMMQMIGFSNIVTACELYRIEFENFRSMCRFLQTRGGNPLVQRSKTNPGKRFFARCEEIYKSKFSNKNKIYITVEVIYIFATS